MYSEYFDAVYNSWLSASISAGSEVNKYIKVNGFSICLSFCGSEMISSIMPAFEHILCQQTPERDLTVCMWDSTTTGIKLPVVPWKINDIVLDGEIWTYDDETLMIVFQPAKNTIMLLNKKRNLGIYWVHDASTVPYHDKASPLRLIFQRWMRMHSYQAIHAGAVGFHGGGVLLAGKGGSGKSTTSLNCLNSGLLYVGDDYCLITEDPVPYVYSLYNTGKLYARDIELFPSLKPALSNQEQLDVEKALYFFHRCFPEKMSAGFPLRAILIPEISGQTNTKLKRVSPARGFLALSPTTIFQMPRADQADANRFLDRFVRKLPNYILELGTDLSQIPRVIIDLLKSSNNE